MDARLRAAAVCAAVALLLTGCVQSRPLAPVPTAAELALLDARVRDIQWQYLGFTPDAPRPDIEFIEYVDPLRTDEVYTACMVDAGFPDYDPYVGNSDTDERLALFTCISEYPLEPRQYNLFTAAQLDYLYDYYQDTLVPCLEASGVDQIAIPSRTEFTKPLQGGGQYLWTPWDSARIMTQQEYMSIVLRCPDLSQQLLSPPRE